MGGTAAGAAGNKRNLRKIVAVHNPEQMKLEEEEDMDTLPPSLVLDSFGTGGTVVATGGVQMMDVPLVVDQHNQRILHLGTAAAAVGETDLGDLA